MTHRLLRRPPPAGKLARATFHLQWAFPLALLAPPAVAADPAQGLPDITVTAEHASMLATPTSTGSNLDLTPLETPASVSVITREQLEDRGDAKLVDAITRSAGFSSLGHPGNGLSALSVRGFTDATSVMRLYDGTRQYGGMGLTFPFDAWSIERIEMLRGPASVIYGDGAIGGVVNVIPKKPTRGPISNEVALTVGTDDTQRFGVGSGGAMNDMLSYRFDLSGDRSDGWVDLGQTRNLTVSGAIQLDVSPEFTMKLRYARGKQNPMRYFGTPLVNGQQLAALRRKNYNVGDSAIEFNDQWAELEAQWTPNAETTLRTRLYQIDSTRYYRNAESYVYNAATGMVDRSRNTEIRHDQSQTGNTTDATFRGHVFGLENHVAVGFDVNASALTHTNNTYSGTSPSVDLQHPVPGYYASSVPFIPRYRNTVSQYAIFAENRLALTARWSVLAGVRYDNAAVSRRDFINANGALEQKFSHVGWRFGTVYAIHPDLSVYGQYAEAADPVSGMLMLAPSNSRFDQSTGKQIEIGVKQAFWNKKGEWTLAAYDIRKNNLLTRDATNPDLRVQVGKRSSTGIEATLSLAFARHWQLDANASILRARYNAFAEAVGGATVSRNGNVPPDVPERLANVWLSWNFTPAWTASGGMRYVGHRYADHANTLKMPAYTTTDLALQWAMAKQTTLTLRGRNVFDKSYFTTAYYTTNQWFNGPGRQFEMTVRHLF